MKQQTLEHWEKINAMAARRFGVGPLAEEAALAVIDRLEAEEWKRLNAYQGEASFWSFLKVVCSRLLEDFARRRYGRLRPPLWVITLGGIWEKLFQALCQERLAVGDAVEVVFQRQGTVDKPRIEEAAFQLLGRIPDCGKAQGFEVSCPEEISSPVAGPEEQHSEQEKRELFETIFQLVLGIDPAHHSGALGERLASCRVSLSAEERLLLKLCYQDGLAVSAAGAMLGLNRFQAHGRMRRLQQRIRAELQRSGLATAILPFLRETAEK